MSDIMTPSPLPQQPRVFTRAEPGPYDILGLIFGILGFTFLPFVGAVTAVIMGHISRAKAFREDKSPAGMSTASLWLGYIGLVIFAIVLIVIIASAVHTAQPCDPSNVNWPNC